MYRFFDWLRHRARLRLWNADRAWGRRGEDLAHRYLKKRGYVIVARNHRSRSGSGEVDIVGWDGEALAFIEVKTRRSAAFGTPDRAVDMEKRRRLILAAIDYCRRTYTDWEKSRFDIVTVVLGKPPKVELIRDAFERPVSRAEKAKAAGA